MTEYEATLEELELELWLRRRNDGRILVTGEDGSRIPLMNISDGQLEHAIKRRLEERPRPETC